MIQVYMGNGKGKTTASFGLAFRAVGHGLKVLIVQFMKPSDFITGEMISAKKLVPELKVIQFGDSKTWGFGVPKTEYQEDAKVAANQALDFANQQLNKNWNMIILDEIGVAINQGLVEIQDVIDLIAIRPSDMELVLTGSTMDLKIIEVADYVSKIEEVKHPYNFGIEARKGIEY